jgi:Xaa-Pro dipeptidase
MAELETLFEQHMGDLLARHRQLMQEHGFEYLIIPSGEPIGVYLDDMYYPFKSSFFFRTYAPLTELAHSYLIIGLSGKPTLVYYQPVDFWHKVADDPEGFWVKHFDIQMIAQKDDAKQFLPKDGENLAILGQANAITESLSQAKQNPEALINAIYWQRAYKSDYEIACLKTANERAVICHQVAEQAFRQGKSEQQIHLAYVEASGVLEHQMPYSNIVALNQNGAILHYTECEAKAPSQIKSFLIDAGVSCHGYHSDITRTYAYQKDEFADLIDAMEAMQLACIDSIEIGQPYIELHHQAHLSIAEIVRRFGFVDMSAESMVENGISGVFFPHGLGHLLGLQVHDVGGQFADASGKPNPPDSRYPFLRTTRSIEPGMVYTIEPGLYFIDSLLKPYRDNEFKQAFNWNKIESFMGYGGIRIEDNISVKDDKVVNLTRDAYAKI